MSAAIACVHLQPLGKPVSVSVKQADQRRELFFFLSKSYDVSVCKYLFLNYHLLRTYYIPVTMVTPYMYYFIWPSQVTQWLSIHLPSRRLRFIPWVGKIPWRRTWQPTPVFLPGKFHGQRSLRGCSPWSRKELDMTERLNNSRSSQQPYEVRIFFNPHYSGGEIGSERVSSLSRLHSRCVTDLGFESLNTLLLVY